MVSTITDRVYGESASVAVKAPCIAASVGAPLPLSGLTPVGSYTPFQGDRILVKDQTDATTNGVYNASTGAWARAGDFDGPYDAVQGTLIVVYLTNGQALMYQLVTANPVIGTSTLDFASFINPTSLAILQTPIEANLGIVPVNLSYRPGCVDRYATNVFSGITSMHAAFQAAINQARAGGEDVTWGITAPYLLDVGALDCTVTNNAVPAYGITFRQTGTPWVNRPGNFRAGLIVGHNDYTVFDCTGQSAVTVYDMTLTNNSTVTYPKLCFLLARNSSGGSLLPRFYNTKIDGYFSTALLYNYAAEDGVYMGNYWANSATDVGAKLVALTANNNVLPGNGGGGIGFLSSFSPIFVGNKSCIDHQFIGGQYLLKGASATSDLFYLDGVVHLKVDKPWLYNLNGRSFFYMDTTNSVSNFIKLRDLQGENGGAPAYGVLFPNTAGTPVGWVLEDVYWNVGTFSVAAAGATPTIDNLRVINLQEQVTKGISIPGTLQNSNVDYNGVITLGTSAHNWIRGPIVNMTITTHVQDMIIDQPTGSIIVKGSLSMNGQPAFGTQNGWGTPTAGSIVNNFPGSGASTSQCGQAITELIIQLKNMGVLGA